MSHSRDPFVFVTERRLPSPGARALRAATVEQVARARHEAVAASEDLELRARPGRLHGALPGGARGDRRARGCGSRGGRRRAGGGASGRGGRPRRRRAPAAGARSDLRRPLRVGSRRSQLSNVPALKPSIALAYEKAERRVADLELPRARPQLEQWNQRIVTIEGALERIAPDRTTPDRADGGATMRPEAPWGNRSAAAMGPAHRPRESPREPPARPAASDPAERTARRRPTLDAHPARRASLGESAARPGAVDRRPVHRDRSAPAA